MQTTVEPLPRPEMGGALAVGLRRAVYGRLLAHAWETSGADEP
jgi:hypothetical protein